MFESAGHHGGPKWLWLLICALIGLVLIVALLWILRLTRMPLRSYRGPLPALSSAQSELAGRLAAHVNALSVTIGERSISKPESLRAVIGYASEELAVPATKCPSIPTHWMVRKSAISKQFWLGVKRKAAL